MRILRKLHLKFAYLRYSIYQWIGLHDHDICEVCLKMFDTARGYGRWSDITSCTQCGPTDDDLREIRHETLCE